MYCKVRADLPIVIEDNRIYGDVLLLLLLLLLLLWMKQILRLLFGVMVMIKMID